jgi:hypothetical protein
MRHPSQSNTLLVLASVGLIVTLALISRTSIVLSPRQSGAPSSAGHALSAQPSTAEEFNEAGDEARSHADYVSAARLYLSAAEEGLAEPQTSLALLYLDGRGVRRDERAALKWFTAAALQEFAPAQFGLGSLYEAGMAGLPQDVHMARGYYDLAAAQGNEDARSALSDLDKRKDKWVRLPPRQGEFPAVAKAVGAVPWAIICPDERTDDAMFHAIGEYVVEKLQEGVTHGQSVLVQGKPVFPDAEAWGCVLVPAGTPLSVDSKNIVPIASAESADGRIYTGVIGAGMFTRNDAPGNTSTRH